MQPTALFEFNRNCRFGYEDHGSAVSRRRNGLGNVSFENFIAFAGCPFFVGKHIALQRGDTRFAARCAGRQKVQNRPAYKVECDYRRTGSRVCSPSVCRRKHKAGCGGGGNKGNEIPSEQGSGGDIRQESRHRNRSSAPWEGKRSDRSYPFGDNRRRAEAEKPQLTSAKRQVCKKCRRLQCRVKQRYQQAGAYQHKNRLHLRKTEACIRVQLRKKGIKRQIKRKKINERADPDMPGSALFFDRVKQQPQRYRGEYPCLLRKIRQSGSKPRSRADRHGVRGKLFYRRAIQGFRPSA